MSADTTSTTTILKIHGMAQPLSDSQRVDFSKTLVSCLGTLLWHPGHTLEFMYSSSPAIATWKGGFAALLSIRHIDIQAYLKVTTYAGQRVSTNDIQDIHLPFLEYLRDRLQETVLISEVNESDLPLRSPAHETSAIELDSNGCSGGVVFDDMALGLGSTLPWAMNFKLQSGGDEALSLLRNSTRFGRWLKIVTGLNILDDYDQVLWDEVPLGRESSQLVRHTFALTTGGADTREQITNAAIVDAHLSGTPAASIAKSQVMSVMQAGLLMPLYHTGSPWILAEHTIPFMSRTGQIIAFDPGAIEMSGRCEFVFDPHGLHSTDYHTLVNNALMANGCPVTRRVAIDFDAALSTREADATQPSQRLKLDLGASQSINLMGTPLGVHKATERVVTDLACLLEILCDISVPAFGWYTASCGLAEEAFRMCSLSVYPKPYYPGIDSLVDSAIDLLGDDHPATWREISEQLMNLGFVTEAVRAHERSIPTLQDVLTVIQSKHLDRSCFSRDEGVKIGNALERLLASKPSLGNPTNVQIEQSEALTITVDEHLRIEGFSQYTSTMLQYLVARKLATFGLLEEYHPDCNEVFRSHHEKLRHAHRNTRKVSYFSVEKLIGQTRLISAIQGDARYARSLGIAISITTREMHQSLMDARDLCHVFAAFGLGYLDRQEFEDAIKLNLERCGAPEDHHYEDKGFFFRAYLKSYPYCMSNFLYLPKMVDTKRG